MTTASDPAAVPFFIVGCVRSGTTILRDVLRSHPDLYCPEETHIYRWSWPFGSELFRQFMTQAVLRRHHAMNGVSPEALEALFDSCRSRAEFLTGYLAVSMRAKGMVGRRWFEKTPQNIYGAALLAEDFPTSRFVVIERDPLAVIASLKRGVVMKVDSVVAAANYWREAALLGQALRRAHPARVFHLTHERLMAEPRPLLAELAGFLALERPEAMNAGLIRSLRRRILDHLSEDEVRLAGSILGLSIDLEALRRQPPQKLARPRHETSH